MKPKLMLAAMALAGAVAGMPALADDKATPEQLTQIDAALAAMNCEVDHDNVEVEAGVFDLDDVICADGQYDVKLDSAYTVVDRRKE